MSQIKAYLWIVPFIGGIVTVIALLTPAASYTSSGYFYFYWIWGFTSYNTVPLGTHIGFDKYLVGLLPSIICSVIIVTSMVKILISISDYRKNISYLSLYPGILIIIGTISWAVIINNLANIVHYNSSFWESLTPGFGVIGLIIGGGLLIIGYILAKIFGEPIEEPIEIILPEAEYKPQRKKEIILEKVETKELNNKISPPSKAKAGNFCINCGKPIHPTWNVCAYCGQRVRDVSPLQESVIDSEVKPVESIISQTKKHAQVSELDNKELEPIPLIDDDLKMEPIPEKTKKIEPQIITCPFCDSQIDVNQNYCQYCGYVVKK